MLNVQQNRVSYCPETPPEYRLGRRSVSGSLRKMGCLGMSAAAHSEAQTAQVWGKMDEKPVAIEVTDLHKRFGPLEVLKGISLRANQGDIIAIIGGSGSGKSTFLRCLNLLEQPSGGSITIHGETI